MIQNKNFSRYFIYAIGEIILVVFGILIALQINNWNEDRKNRILEKSLLKELKTSIKDDSIGIFYNVRNFGRIEREANYLDSMIKNRLPYEKRVDSAFGIISAFNVTEANYVPFEKIKTLPNGIIRNDSLFNSLSEYYNYSKFLAGVDRYFQNGAYFRQHIYPKYFKGYRYGRIAVVSDYDKILDSDEIKVAIDYCINDSGYYLNNSEHRFEHATQLIQDITKELERFKND